jgi:hypothetical protein
LPFGTAGKENLHQLFCTVIWEFHVSRESRSQCPSGIKLSLLNRLPNRLESTESAVIRWPW